MILNNPILSLCIAAITVATVVFVSVRYATRYSVIAILIFVLLTGWVVDQVMRESISNAKFWLNADRNEFVYQPVSKILQNLVLTSDSENRELLHTKLILFEEQWYDICFGTNNSPDIAESIINLKYKPKSQQIDGSDS